MIDRVRACVTLGEIEDAILIVYTEVDGLLTAGKFDDAAALLPGLHGTPLVVMLSGLTSTLPAIAEMGAARVDLYRATREAAGERADEVLRGLA